MSALIYITGIMMYAVVASFLTDDLRKGTF